MWQGFRKAPDENFIYWPHPVWTYLCQEDNIQGESKSDLLFESIHPPRNDKAVSVHRSRMKLSTKEISF